MTIAEAKHALTAEDRQDSCTCEACAMRRAMEEQGRELERTRRELIEAREVLRKDDARLPRRV